MKSFREIATAISPLSQVLDKAPYYYAHLPKQDENRAPETLEQHLQCVLHYFLELCEQHQLDEVVNNLIHDLIPVHLIQSAEVENYLKTVFLDVIWFHDFGKVNHFFQQEKMKNSYPNFLKVKHTLGSDHARIGAYLFLMYHFKQSSRFELEVTNFLDAFLIASSYSIIKHHAATLSNLPDYDFFSSKHKVLSQYLILLDWQITADDLACFHNLLSVDKQDVFMRYYNETANQTASSFPLFALLKLNFSLLTAADYYATAHYMNDWQQPFNGFGIVKQELRERIIYNAGTLQPYNQNTYRRLEELLQKDEQTLIEPTPNNLNELRAKMAAEVITTIRSQAQNNLFYLEAPTGGGKTNMSMLAVAELLKANPTLNKIFYVFPFTTLITQTYTAIAETLGLQPDELTQLHSKAGWQTKNTAEDADAEYGKDRKNFIDNLFVNYPITLLSHVLFFDVIKTNKKERNYLLHRLANAVVVIDELQSYNPEHWDKLAYFTQQYAHAFNIKFILMSATLPKLGDLQSVIPQKITFTPLVQDAIPRFFKNPNFGKRVSFNFDLLENPDFKTPELKDKDGREAYLNCLYTFLIEKTKERKAAFTDYPVRTVIEFIFKKTASEFYKIASQELGKQYEHILVLSGTILEPRRKQIINFLKSKNTESVLLITTQVVEAGVDIDMDLGFKDTSLLDSEEQLAGRINRNVTKEDCQLFLFNLDDAKVIYGKDKRYQQQKQESFQPHFKRILADKAFDELYKKVYAIIDKNNSQEYIKNFRDYKSYLQQLNFPEADKKFRLIEEDSISVFVPIPVPIAVAGKELEKPDKIFTNDELNFLKSKDILPKKHLFGEEYLDSIDGVEVFQLYRDLINERKPKSKERDFITEKLMGKRMQGIMSKYIFSMLNYSKDYKDLQTYGLRNKDKDGNEYGYFYLENTDVYDYLSGIKDEVVINSNFI
ncbi:CRISPR-associated helicase Cas3' [Adhaeribacter arboris]|uniref:CRISPR-associated helicase Cas3 n=1 Tax=Adhaeribacter arboris TaxID=2072846 RepID=A0A2T2YHF0_9BACT|nr:CRISPR-associated helicase Cas3' [Adhaeribacter arboris]PSR54934.1 CRISPR-associated helicase Cas3' [Adhaeribacter arboris]